MNIENLNYGDSLKKAVEFEAEKNTTVRHMIIVLQECGFGRKFILSKVKQDLKGIVRPSLIVHFANEILNQPEEWNTQKGSVSNLADTRFANDCNNSADE